MKRTLSLRAMLIGLFLAAVIGAVVLAATGLMSNQRLVDSQRFILGEVLPQQEASRGMVDAMVAFGERHADLLAAGSDEAMAEAVPQDVLDERFLAARQGLVEREEVAQRDRLERLDADHAALLEADSALEAVRREDLALRETMDERITAMQQRIVEVMVSAEDMAGRATLADVRERRQQREQVEAWLEEGMTTLPTALVEGLFDDGGNIADISSGVRTAVALLADLGRQLTQVESSDRLVNLRYNEIAQQLNLARQSLATIAGSPSASVEQSERAEALTEIIGELDGLMVGGDQSVYALRHEQLELRQREAQALSDVTTAMHGMRDTLGELEADGVAQADLAAGQAEELANAGRVLQIGVTLAVILVLAIFGWRTLVRVLGPLGQMRRQMESISGAGGENADLSLRLALQRDDEIGRTAQAFNRMMDTFESIVAQIRDGAGAIAASSRDIASGNDDLSQRTEEQSSSLAETASSLEQITATVKQTADYANQARDASQEVDRRAHSAGDVAGRTNDAMQAIRHSSEKITSIITAIDDIAFQTNLLALNASVEAARAGEQGRGFAVVAQEVRKLASRSAEEASQIRHLVDDSVNKVGEGASLVRATSEHLQEIIDSLKHVSGYVTEIAGATHEQSAGIEQINQAIAQLDQVTHQNAQLVQEASSASHVLDQQAADMHALVGRFQVAAVSADHGAARLEPPQEEHTTWR
ncbi:HAMP domain-containing protein [Halomonas sp. ML-15]|uniref:methyl-accepting chemotaxis protein n=1 Tax=Halomonas sp. ML-15 TaxID=2773305 RepID=UPI001745CA4D|nr:methyl-accepting chemotaxis protein [Halomonas sp. ML-15]MBD3896543.1 HAMP domain-containing protein [Halomonas sp. ML-15]